MPVWDQSHVLRNACLGPVPSTHFQLGTRCFHPVPSFHPVPCFKKSLFGTSPKQPFSTWDQSHVGNYPYMGPVPCRNFDFKLCMYIVFISSLYKIEFLNKLKKLHLFTKCFLEMCLSGSYTLSRRVKYNIKID